MAAPGPASCFSPFPLSHCSLPLSVIVCGHVSSGLVPGHGENGVCSGLCQAAEVPAQTVSTQPKRLNRCQYQQVVFHRFPLLPDSATEETARDATGLCLRLKESVRGLERAHQLCCPSLSHQSLTSRRSQRSRFWKFHSPCVGRAEPRLHLAGSPKKPDVKRDPPPAHTTGRQPRNPPVVKLRTKSHSGRGRGWGSHRTNDTKERALELTRRREPGPRHVCLFWETDRML